MMDADNTKQIRYSSVSIILGHPDNQMNKYKHITNGKKNL